MDFKICYYFDSGGKYGGEGFIPPIKGQHPLPSTATWSKPDAPDGFYPVWNGFNWTYELEPVDFEATEGFISEQGDD